MKYNNLNRYFLLSNVVLMLVGCVSTGANFSQQIHAKPAWVKNPPVDTNDYWYGIGSGFNRDLATKNALSEIASRLRVAVQSEVEMHSTKETENGQSTVKERFTAVDKLSTGAAIHFPGHEVQRTEELDGQIYTLVAVNRDQFVQQYNRNIEATARSVQENLKRLHAKQPIEQYIEKKELYEHTYQLLSLTDLLAAVDSSFLTQAQVYRRQVSDALSFLSEVKNKLKFHLIADTTSRYLITTIRELFNTEQLPVTDHKKSDDTIIKLTSTILSNERDSMGGYEVSIKTQITMQTTSGHIVGNRSLTLYGASANNEEYAKRALADDLKEKIEEEGGIFVFLNRNES